MECVPTSSVIPCALNGDGDDGDGGDGPDSMHGINISSLVMCSDLIGLSNIFLESENNRNYYSMYMYFYSTFQPLAGKENFPVIRGVVFLGSLRQLPQHHFGLFGITKLVKKP